MRMRNSTSPTTKRLRRVTKTMKKLMNYQPTSPLRNTGVVSLLKYLVALVSNPNMK